MALYEGGCCPAATPAAYTAANSCFFVPGAAEWAKVRGNIKGFQCGDTQQVWDDVRKQKIKMRQKSSL